MSFGMSRRLGKHTTSAASEKADKHEKMRAWEARWGALSAQARDVFLNVVKGPPKNAMIYPSQLTVKVNKFPPHILQELKDAGFVEVKRPNANASAERVYANTGLHDFATRVRNLRKFHVLAADQPSEFAKYIGHTFHSGHLSGVITAVLSKVGIDTYVQVETAVGRYVTQHRWPGWVARELDDPLAGQILDAVQNAGGSMRLAELPDLIEGSPPEQLRSVVDALISRFALVEDLRPGTWEIVIGLLPAVREDVIRAIMPRQRPPLVVCDRPKEVGGDRGVLVDDLRAVLLEVASVPPLLRQDQELYHKETDRFLAELEPVDAWLLSTLKWDNEWRLKQILTWARCLQLVRNHSQGTQVRLQLTPKGQAWLSGSVTEQYLEIYDVLRGIGPLNDIGVERWGFTYPGMNPFQNEKTGDARFLGEHVAVLKANNRNVVSYTITDAKTEDEGAVRELLDRALAVLIPGVFYRLESVESHLAFGEFNPLNRGLPLNEVHVYLGHRSIPALDEEREEAGRRLIAAFVWRRLIPLGCVRTGIDDEGRICIARAPRYDAYFGREIGQSDVTPTADLAAKVVIQPDFTVIVIGLNPVPIAELAPFCERTNRGGGQGAMIFKITRESVIKAVSNGLNPEEIATRLERHASNEVPANVLRQVKDWSSWVRQVTSSTRTLIRCPDSDTADRVVAALKSQAERVNDKLVVVNCSMLTAAERSKLKAQGIIVHGPISLGKNWE